jgi:FMN phosphatase YigB (HAD superfamily)
MKNKLIVFDFNRTLYDPDKNESIVGAVAILEKYFKSNVEMVLISRLEYGRRDFVEKMGWNKYFSDILFVKEKSEELFKSLLNKYNNHKIYVVGDYLYEEIRYGNMNDMETVWIKNGKFKNMRPRNIHDIPKHTIDNISKLASIIE